MRDVSREELLNELRELRNELRRKGVMHMSLFGSRARRDNRLDSDIDLVIETDESRKFSLLDLVGVAHEIEDNLGLSANLFMRRSLEPDTLVEVRRDQVEVF